MTKLSVSATLELTPQEMGFWPDLEPDTNIWRFRDRVFIGDAADCTGDRCPPQGSWLPDDTAGPSWLIRDSQLAVMQSRGIIAITGGSRGSDQESGQGPAEIIGLAGFTLNDTPDGRAWGVYSDLQHEPGAWSSFGLEVAAKNKGENKTATPYNVQTGGVFGAWLAGGGDNAYGGDPVNPSNAAIVILKNHHTWNRGIVIAKDALTGCDGVTGAAVAVHMARGHAIRWDAPNGKAADIRSDVSDTANRVAQVFQDNKVAFFGQNDKQLAELRHVTGAVNYPWLSDAASGAAATIGASGADTDVDLKLVPKGAGHVQFGAHLTHADVAIAGYVEIKDASGTIRKLAVIA